jgi:hypothetical protein
MWFAGSEAPTTLIAKEEPSAMDSFVYIWTNLTTGRKYIGVHKGDSDDGYICSSKIMLEEYQINPSNFKREIIAYGTFEDMYNLETKMLHEINAAENSNYYNQSNNNGQFYIKKHNEQTKEKIRQKALGRPGWNKGLPNPKQKEKMLKDNPMKRPEIAAKVAEKNRGKIPYNKGKGKGEIRAKSKGSKGYGKDGRKKTIWTFIDGTKIVVDDTRKMCDKLGLSYSAVRHKIGKGPYVKGEHIGLSIERYDYTTSQEPAVQLNSCVPVVVSRFS